MSTPAVILAYDDLVNLNHARDAGSVRVHGPALRYIRQLSGRTIGSLAREAGVSTSFLAQVERGVRPGMTTPVFEVLVRELQISDPRVLMSNPSVAPATVSAA